MSGGSLCLFIADPSIVYFFFIFWGTLPPAFSNLVIGVARVGGWYRKGFGCRHGVLRLTVLS